MSTFLERIRAVLYPHGGMKGGRCPKCRVEVLLTCRDVDLVLRCTDCSWEEVEPPEGPTLLRAYDVYDSSNQVCRHCRMAGGGNCRLCWRRETGR
jgi:hypothetical protein